MLVAIWQHFSLVQFPHLWHGKDFREFLWGFGEIRLKELNTTCGLWAQCVRRNLELESDSWHRDFLAVTDYLSFSASQYLRRNIDVQSYSCFPPERLICWHQRVRLCRQQGSLFIWSGPSGVVTTIPYVETAPLSFPTWLGSSPGGTPVTTQFAFGRPLQPLGSSLLLFVFFLFIGVY